MRTWTTTSSQTSAQVSTLRGPDFVPYWINVTKDWPTKLLSCTKKDLCDLDSTCWKSCCKNLASNSWFTVHAHKYLNTPENKNCQKTCSPSLMSLSQVIMADEQQKIEEDSKKNAKKSQTT